MKKTLNSVTLAFLLLFSLSLQAQKISLGARAGVQQANVVVPDFIQDATFLPDFKNIQTANFGVTAELELHPNFAIQPEMSYNTKGFMIRENFDLELYDVPLPLGVTAISRFNYLEMPVLAKAKFGNFYLMAGPTFGYAVSGKLETRARALVEFDLFETKIDLDEVGYERWEVGGMAGAGVSVPVFQGGQIFLDVRYAHGFTEAYDIPLVHEKVQHKNIGINVGFMLPISRQESVILKP